MLPGKAIVGAVRAQFIVDAALNALLLCNTFDVPLPRQTDNSEDTESEDLDSDETPSVNDTELQIRTGEQTWTKLLLSMIS